MTYYLVSQKVSFLCCALWLWLPILCFNQWVLRPFILYTSQCKKTLATNITKFIVVLVGGFGGFAILQLLFVYQSFEQIPKNVLKFLKDPSFSKGLMLLLWENRNKMEEKISDFIDDMEIGTRREYEVMELSEKRA